MALLTAQTAAADGTAITFSAASASDTFANTGNERFVIKNGSGSSINVTFDSPTTCEFAAAASSAHDLVVAVAAGAETWVGPLSMARFNDPSTGLVTVTYSSTTTVTVAVVRR